MAFGRLPDLLLPIFLNANTCTMIGRLSLSGRRGRGERRREVYVAEMRDPSRWNVREVVECESGTVQREVWYREHDDTWCHRYTVGKS